MIGKNRDLSKSGSLACSMNMWLLGGPCVASEEHVDLITDHSSVILLVREMNSPGIILLFHVGYISGLHVNYDLI